MNIIVFRSEIIPEGSAHWKLAPWQKMLAPQRVGVLFPEIEEIILLDPDILISDIAKNPLDINLPDGRFGVVSQFKDMPYPWDETVKRISFQRRRHMDSNYPLDSLITASPPTLYSLANLPAHQDYFCGGLMTMRIGEASDLLADWYFEVSAEEAELDVSKPSWGEEINLNHFVFSGNHQVMLPYEFQTLWLFEMAWKFPSLYESYPWEEEDEVITDRIRDSLSTCSFLHFAGSWPESALWRNKIRRDVEAVFPPDSYLQYQRTAVEGRSRGRLAPPELSSSNERES